MTEDQPAPVDLLGVGFGPSNLAVAIAVAEHNAAVPPDDALVARFVERQEGFGWHRGMLIDDATMQVSFLKDLVTLRNPVSSFGFLSYLHDRGRLVDFINYGSVYPTRVEFHDYLEWAAAGFTGQVDYGREVVEVRPVRIAGRVPLVEVVTRDTGGAEHVHRARNVVLATGLTPHLPRGVSTGPRIWHSSRLLPSIPAVATPPRRVAVVGAGQSAAECVDHLHRTFPDAEVCAVFARYGYSPADDSSFANRIFDPAAVDDFYSAPDGVKQMLMGYHGNTNYSVVDPELIDELYRRHYRERVAGRERLRFFNVSRVADIVEVDDGVELAVESLIDGSRSVLTSDVVVFATGYRPADPRGLLGELAAHCRTDPGGRLEISREYRVVTDDEVTAGIFVQGATEHTHGLTSTLLSTTAIRSAEIVGAVASGRRTPAPADVTVAP